MLNWFCSYLENSKSRVRINDSFSPYILYNIGVPQGSILRPILFTLYINDLNKTSNKLEFIHYADDTSVMISGSDLEDTCNLLNYSLNLIDEWLMGNRLSLNVSKTSYLLFTHNPLYNGSPCLLYTSPSPRDKRQSRMPSSA